MQTTKRINYELIRNSLQVRKNGTLEEKKRLIQNIFPEGLPVNQEKHIAIPNLSLVYQIFETGKSDECKMLELISENLNQLV